MFDESFRSALSEVEWHYVDFTLILSRLAVALPDRLAGHGRSSACATAVAWLSADGLRSAGLISEHGRARLSQGQGCARLKYVMQGEAYAAAGQR